MLCCCFWLRLPRPFAYSCYCEGARGFHGSPWNVKGFLTQNQYDGWKFCSFGNGEEVNYVGSMFILFIMWEVNEDFPKGEVLELGLNQGAKVLSLLFGGGSLGRHSGQQGHSSLP